MNWRGAAPCLSRQASSPLGRWLLLVSLLYCFAMAISLARGLNPADEAWFLQVLDRCIRGEVLYRDVFYGAMPLGVYIALPAVRLFGSEIIVVKAMVALCSLLTVLLSLRIARQLDVSRSAFFLLTAALLVSAAPQNHALYQPLAELLLLASFVWALGCLEGPRSFRSYWLGGALAGLCFAAKQNVGIYVLGVLNMTLLVEWVDSKWSASYGLRVVGSVAFGFASICFLAVLPVWWTGGLEKLLDYGFMNKGTYLRLGRISYFDQLALILSWVRSPSTLDFSAIYPYSFFLLPWLAFPALAATRVLGRGSDRRRGLIMLAFAGAAFLGVFPRADLDHMIYAVPALLLALAFSWRAIRSRLPRLVAGALTAAWVLWIGAGVGLLAEELYSNGLTDRSVTSQIPHFRYARVPSSQYAELKENIDALEAARPEQPFIFSPHAGFYYLATGLKNRTPFDYPLVTAFGLNGEEEMSRAVAGGQIRSIWQDVSITGPLAPEQLLRAVQEHMKPIQQFRFSTLYRYGS